MIVRPATLAALLFAVLALAVSACGSDDEDTAGGGEATAVATQDADSGGTATPTEDADADDQGEDNDQGEEGEEGEEGETAEEREREEAEAKESADQDCSKVGDLDAEPKTAVPDDVAVLQGAHVYESEGPFGKTVRYFAAIDGTPEDLAARRDDAARQLEGVGFKSLSTDQEEGTEAEAHMQGDKHTVDIQVISLCEGKLRIRYTVS